MKNIDKLKAAIQNMNAEQLNNFIKGKTRCSLQYQDVSEVCCSKNCNCNECFMEWLNRDDEKKYYVFRDIYHSKSEYLYVKDFCNEKDLVTICYDKDEVKLYDYNEAVAIRDKLNEKRKGHYYLWEIHEKKLRDHKGDMLFNVYKQFVKS